MVRKSLKKQNYKRKSGGGKFSKKNYKGYGKGNSKNNLQNKANQEFIKSLQKALIQGGALELPNVFNKNTHLEWRVVKLTSTPTKININDKASSVFNWSKPLRTITAEIMLPTEGYSDNNLQTVTNYDYTKATEYLKPDLIDPLKIYSKGNNGIIQSEFAEKHDKIKDKDLIDKYNAAVKEYDSAKKQLESDRAVLQNLLNPRTSLFKNNNNGTTTLTDNDKNNITTALANTESNKLQINATETTNTTAEINTKIESFKNSMIKAETTATAANSILGDELVTYIAASFMCDNTDRKIKGLKEVNFMGTKIKGTEAADANTDNGEGEGED